MEEKETERVGRLHFHPPPWNPRGQCLVLATDSKQQPRRHPRLWAPLSHWQLVCSAELFAIFSNLSAEVLGVKPRQHGHPATHTEHLSTNSNSKNTSPNVPQFSIGCLDQIGHDQRRPILLRQTSFPSLIDWTRSRRSLGAQTATLPPELST